MFLAMGVGAFTAGIFHLMTHAFFKACLFLGSGSVIHGMHHGLHHAHSHDDPQDMRNMGGLSKKMKITYWTFLISTIAIAGIPPLAGFFSKDEILWWSFASTRGHWLLWLTATAAAMMTAFYKFRLVSMTFWGESRTNPKAKDHIPESPWTITVPLIILAGLAAVGGFVGVPALLGGSNHLANFLEPVFGHAQETFNLSAHGSHATEYGLMFFSVVVASIGIGIALYMYNKNPDLPGKFVAKFPGLHRAVFNKWYVDEIYDALFVNPTKKLGTFLWKGFDVKVVDGVVNGVAATVEACARGMRYTQSGLIASYAMTMVIGVFAIVGYYIFFK
jgi:NADH-quinone oxidoreductase subunit L